jgi:predicted  nucleic acid-binding Zn-ribbon protein
VIDLLKSDEPFTASDDEAIMDALDEIDSEEEELQAELRTLGESLQRPASEVKHRYAALLEEVAAADARVSIRGKGASCGKCPARNNGRESDSDDRDQQPPAKRARKSSKG